MNPYQTGLAGETDDCVAATDSFPPTAIAKDWIEQLAKPYEERPWAVIRELVQNANDAVVMDDGSDHRQVELALLDTDPAPKPDRYQLVVRDSGHGMTDESLRANLGILGGGIKRSFASAIGQFGVGFYSTHAIAFDVVVLSRVRGTGETIGWRYIPQSKMFYRIPATLQQQLLATDFENHPIATRRRFHGTSVYLNIDFDNNERCCEWLTPEFLLAEARRDFFLLRVPVFIANLSGGGSHPLPILDSSQTDITHTALSLPAAPWDLVGPERTSAANDFLRANFPKARSDADLPSEWTSFSIPVGFSKVEGLIYLPMDSPRGQVNLYMKRMWVEAARDIAPAIARPLHAVVNIEPAADGLNVGITPQRDHLIRDQFFDQCRSHVEQAMIAFLEETAERLVDRLQVETAGLTDLTEKVKTIRSILNGSAVFQMLTAASREMEGLLRDVPATIKSLITASDCPAPLVECVTLFVKKHLLADTVISRHDLPNALEQMQVVANREAARNRTAVERKEINWSPQASKDFLIRVGRYLPVTLAVRDRKREGGFSVVLCPLPLCAVPILDPQTTHSAQVILKGAAEDYLAKNTKVSSAILPTLSNYPGPLETKLYALTIGLSQFLQPDKFPKLEFKEHVPEVFTSIVTEDIWVPLIECFERIINTKHAAATAVKIEAKGYVGLGEKMVPLLFGGGRLVINAYNRLMQDMQSAYGMAADRNDEQSTNLISSICHELYHHAVPIDTDLRTIDVHALDTRNDVYLQTLSLLQKYNDRRS
jgi:hypothetical protein